MQELADDLPLFAAVREKAEAQPATSPALDALTQINPDELSPKEALEKLYELKSLQAK